MLDIAPGVALLPDLHHFVAFAIAGLALNLVPGADMTFVIASAARAGKRGGLAAGAAYLLYIAIGLVRTVPATGTGHAGPTVPASSAAIFRKGALVNLLNPKVGMFFLAFLPQFVDPAAAVPALQILALGLWFDLVGTAVNALVAIGAAGAANRLRHHDWLTRAAKWFAAAALAGMALRLAVDRR